MKSKCKCSLSFSDNKKLCHAFFPSYCIIIIINKKKRTFLAQMFLFIRTIAASGLFPPPSLTEEALRSEGSRGSVPGARVAADPRLLSCKYHTDRNVGRKEDLEGPMQVCSKSPRPPPFECTTDDQVVLYCLSLCHAGAEHNMLCRMHLLRLSDFHFHRTHPKHVDIGKYSNDIY